MSIAPGIIPRLTALQDELAAIEADPPRATDWIPDFGDKMIKLAQVNMGLARVIVDLLALRRQ